ncbi:ADK2 [Symbiodinium sp. CCMP2592]|nr:ADK2 [Symbiodinium sp. CCMP2592]
MNESAPPLLQGGGILGRFENVRVKKSAKKTVTCDAATPEYLRHDFLKPQHLPIERVDEQANFIATSNINETRFHKGFHRRHQADIQQDAARLEHEAARDWARQERAAAQASAAHHLRDKCTFNILTGEGVGRECEFRHVGKKILNPYGSMQATFSEHDREERHRVKNSKHRFFEHPAPEKQATAGRAFLSSSAIFRCVALLTISLTYKLFHRSQSTKHHTMEMRARLSWVDLEHLEHSESFTRWEVGGSSLASFAVFPFVTKSRGVAFGWKVAAPAQEM